MTEECGGAGQHLWPLEGSGFFVSFDSYGVLFLSFIKDSIPSFISSGLFIPPHLLSPLAHHLHARTRPEPDITMQECLLGLLPGCEHCRGRLVVGERLLMGHEGYNSST